MIAFNLFRRRRAPDLLCAVPEDLAVPAFIGADRWEFEGKTERSKPPRGFNVRAASTSVKVNGFYMFQRA